MFLLFDDNFGTSRSNMFFVCEERVNQEMAIDKEESL
jgi:hypothetical protein